MTFDNLKVVLGGFGHGASERLYPCLCPEELIPHLAEGDILVLMDFWSPRWQDCRYAHKKFIRVAPSDEPYSTPVLPDLVVGFLPAPKLNELPKPFFDLRNQWRAVSERTPFRTTKATASKLPDIELDLGDL